MACNLKVISLNVRVIRNQNKRRAIFCYLKQQKTTIFCLQETYSQLDDERIWSAEWGGKIFFCQGTVHSKGVCILLNPNSTSNFDVIQTDPQGRILISKLKILFRYAPHYGIIMHTSYLPTGQRSRLKKVIQMQISSDINPRRRRDNQFFLSCLQGQRVCLYLPILRPLFCFRFFKGVFLVRLLTVFLFVALLFLLASVAYLALDSKGFACPHGDVFDNRR